MASIPTVIEVLFYIKKCFARFKDIYSFRKKLYKEEFAKFTVGYTFKKRCFLEL